MLGGGLALTLAVAFLFLGAVGEAVQALLHLMVAGVAALALALPDHKLQAAGALRRWVLGGSFLAGALLVGLVPVPRAIAAWVAPGLLAAQPQAAWMTLATDPSRVPGELATFVLVLGFGALVVVWGAVRHRRNEAEAAIILGTGALAVSASLHSLLGAQTMLGTIVPQKILPNGGMFAPFVNANHAGSVMLLGGCAAVGVLLDSDQGVPRRAIAGFTATAATYVLVSCGSVGAMLAGGVVAVVWLLRSRGLRLGGVGLVVVLAVVFQVWTSATWGFTSSRAVLWRDSSSMLGDFWLAGTGGGTFGEAIRAYRTDGTFWAFAHAHNEPLEWLLETGVVGAVAALLALVAVGRGLSLPRRADGFAFGLLGLGLHALVEFPLQIPAIAMLAAGVAACLIGVFGPPSDAAPRSVRVVIFAVGLLQFPAAVWQAREAIVGRAADDVSRFGVDAELATLGARTLKISGASRPELLLFEAWAAERRGDPSASALALEVGAQFPDRPDALRQAALVLARTGEFADATGLLQRVIARDPSDYRPRVILARVALAEGDRLLARARWSEAFHRDAPQALFEEAYSSSPSGLIWLQAFSDADAIQSVRLAEFLVRKQKPDEALLALEQAAQLDPVAYRDHGLMRGPLLIAVGRPEEAEIWIEEVLSRRGEDANVLATYGSMLASMGRDGDATAAYLRAARVNSAHRAAALASAEREGGPERALEIARQFELDGDVDAGLRLEIAAVHLRAGDGVGCRAEIERWNLTTSLVGPRAASLLRQCK